MGKRWKRWFYRISSKDANLLEVSGAFIIILSLIMPWFEKVYIKTSNYVFGIQILFSSHLYSKDLLILSKAIIYYLICIPIVILIFSHQRIFLILSITGILFLSVLLYLIPIPIERLSSGIITAYLGLIMISLSFLQK